MPTVLMLDPEEIGIKWSMRLDLGDMSGLIASIKREGQLQPIVVTWTDDNYELVSGRRRLEACRELGCKVAAVVIGTADTGDALWLQIVDNMQRKDTPILELGEALRRHRNLNPELSQKEFKVKAAKELGTTEHVIGNALSLATKLDRRQKKAIREIEDPQKRREAERQALKNIQNRRRALKSAEEARNQEIVGGRLDLGDYVDVLRKYEDESLSFDLAIIDLPDEHLDFERALVTCPPKSPTGDRKIGIDWLQNVKAVLADDATILAFTPAELVGAHVLYFIEHGFDYRGHIVWHITTPNPRQRAGWVPATMCIVWGTRGDPYFDKQWKVKSEILHNVYRCRLPHQHERLPHPEQKPRRLIERLLERHAKPGQNVLDPFMGTGTVPDACKKRGLWFAGIEKEKEYFDLAVNRLKALEGKKKKGGGKGSSSIFKKKKTEAATEE